MLNLTFFICNFTIFSRHLFVMVFLLFHSCDCQSILSLLFHFLFTALKFFLKFFIPHLLCNLSISGLINLKNLTTIWTFYFLHIQIPPNWIRI